MPPKIDLEREFFKSAQGLETYDEVRDAFLVNITKKSEQWINNKFRLDILGLKKT